MKRFALLVMMVCALFAESGCARAQNAGYPAVEEAGFHHCALIYQRPSRTVEEMKPYVARYVNGVPQNQWLFDAFLFWVQETPSGKRTEYGTTTKQDWLGVMDMWFAPEGDVHDWQEAIAQTASALKQGGPPTPRRAIFSIPWMNPQVTNFGDVDGDGKSENLARRADREKVTAWYVREVKARFEARASRHVRLWGFYWMREDLVGADKEDAQKASAIVHANQLKLLWIPYYFARGWNEWKESGFDVAIMQPSYAFRSWMDGGRVRANRLSATAEWGKRYGLGVEIEARGNLESEAERHKFLQYLHRGAASRDGYQKAPTAYFMGQRAVEATYWAGNPAHRAMYEALCRYIAGEEIENPDHALDWKWSASKGRTQIAEATLPAATEVAFVDVFLNEKVTSSIAQNYRAHGFLNVVEPQAWRGSIRVECKTPDEKNWHPVGWAVRAAPDALSGAYQVVTVPVGKKVTALRLALQTDADSAPPQISGITYDETGPQGAAHRALGASYQISPPRPRAAYPHDGTKLNDGIVSEKGMFSGHYVGWNRDPGEMTLTFDLGKSKTIGSVELSTIGGTRNAVNWPMNPVVMLSEEAPRSAISGYGVPPKNLVAWPGTQPRIRTVHGSAEKEGVIVFKGQATNARYVTLFSEVKGWLMASEVKIFAPDGQNLSTQASYQVRPLPSFIGGESYADDGEVLTDGRIVPGYFAGLSGWQGDSEREITLDLQNAAPLHAVTVWAVGGGEADIHAPREVRVTLSADGTRWKEVGEAKSPQKTAEGRAYAQPFTVQFPTPERARFVRVRVQRDRGWTMLSEIEVR